MKVRLDFVTNSSSSSFTCVALYNKELYEFLQGLIADEKYKEQPAWTGKKWWIRPETELYQGSFDWQELKFDRRCFKVQTTEELGKADMESIFRYICSFFKTLDPDEENKLMNLVSETYENDDYQLRMYKALTDGGSDVFDFKGFNTNAHFECEPKNERVQSLLHEIDQIASDPEILDLQKKGIAINRDAINGFGIYDPDSERYSHIDKSFLDKVKLGRLDSEEYKKGLLYEEKRRVWGRFLKDFYKEAIEETGATVLKNITGKSDYVVVFDSIDTAVKDYDIKEYLRKKYGKINDAYTYFEIINHLMRGDVEDIREECYIDYLQTIINDIDAANEKRSSKKPPVAVIWESKLHDYLIKNTSLGNANLKIVMKADGTIQKKPTK